MKIWSQISRACAASLTDEQRLKTGQAHMMRQSIDANSPQQDANANFGAFTACLSAGVIP
jgi:hypothetical protein